ncbi:MAG: hypothetical protein LBT20_00855 [Clostridiales bacterium]|jgi:hypothetical protein|nr:hypothetical protein [Clostridiales bacterium]
MQNKIGAMLMLILPEVVALIAKNYKLSETEAAAALYKSRLYSLLEKEETKLWHFSALTLYRMYDEEVKTGSIVFPEEV